MKIIGMGGPTLLDDFFDGLIANPNDYANRKPPRSRVNFKTFVEVILEDHLQKIEDGEIEWKVNNQHDEYKINEALKLYKDRNVQEKVYEHFIDADLNYLSAIDLAYFIVD